MSYDGSDGSGGGSSSSAPIKCELKVALKEALKYDITAHRIWKDKVAPLIRELYSNEEEYQCFKPELETILFDIRVALISEAKQIDLNGDSFFYLHSHLCILNNSLQVPRLIGITKITDV
jgi:hypothetical protein